MTNISGDLPGGGYYNAYYCASGNVFVTRIYCYLEESDTDFEYIIIKNGEVTKTYKFSEYADISDNQIVNREFVDRYSYNGVMLLYSDAQTLKPDYLRVNIYDGDDINSINSYQYLKAGQQPDFSAFDRPGCTTAYYYNAYSEVDINTVPLDFGLLSAERIALYSAILGEEWGDIYLDGSFTEVSEDDALQCDFYIFITGREDIFSATVYYDDGAELYELSCEVTYGIITRASFYRYAEYTHRSYDFAYNAETGAFRAFLAEDRFDFDVTITQDIFEAYKALGLTLNISADYMTAEYMGWLFLFGDGFKRADINLPEYINDSPLWVWDGDYFSEVEDFLYYTKEFNASGDGYLPCEYDTGLYGKTVVMIFDGRLLLIDCDGYVTFFEIEDDGIYEDASFFDELEEVPRADYTASVPLCSIWDCYWYFEGETDRSAEFIAVLTATGRWVESGDSDTNDTDPITPYTDVWIHGSTCYITYAAPDGTGTWIRLDRV